MAQIRVPHPEVTVTNRLYARKWWWRFIQMGLDGLAWSVALVMAFMLRYSVELTRGSVFDVIDMNSLWLCCAVAVPLQWIFGLIVRIYRGVYGYGEFPEILRAGGAAIATAIVLQLVVIAAASGGMLMPRSAPVIAVAFTLILMAGARFAKRVFVEARDIRELTGDPVVVYGAGSTARTVIRTMLEDSRSHERPIAVVDDNPALHGTKVLGIPVYGSIDDIDALIRELRPKKMVVAISELPQEAFDAVSARMREHSIEVVRIQSVNNKLMGRDEHPTDDRALLNSIRGEINYEINESMLREYIAGKRVLVTGAGGSIGSELCRQIMKFDPALLMMLDRDETLLMETKLSITNESSLDDERIILADIREGENLTKIFTERKPQVVFHAAALKHVSALEAFPEEAYKTNALGSLNVLEAACAAGVETFVNVSTDKAADPTTALGQSKRVAERLTAWYGQKTGRTYVSVRFGNVFGSRGSIKPLFLKQMESGHDITLTHPDANRYFMLIPDACLLVMLAGAIGRPGEVMVLDMGEPVRIYDVADAMRNAFEHYNTDIVITGLRKGEKLGEVLFGGAEQHERSEVNRFISHSSAPALDPEELDYTKWLAHYEATRGYERHGLERALTPEEAREQIAQDLPQEAGRRREIKVRNLR